jgi:hypothetical protein
MDDNKHRLSKEIALDLREELGDGAYLHCVEKLSNGTPNEKLWRDVLSWLDEGVGDAMEIGGRTDKSRRGSEQEKHELGDS